MAIAFLVGDVAASLRTAAAVESASSSGTSRTPQSGQRRLNFENDISPILSRYACNYSGCHGKAEGQNGFKLSVFGFDAQADYDALVKEGRGRRVFPAEPAKSLLLAKASGGMPHGGGIRIAKSSREYELLKQWIGAGLPFGEPDDPKVASIRVEPGEQLLTPQSQRRLRVTARYTDGREEDVTSLARFQSNNESVATVNESGLVKVGDVPGQAAVMAAYNGQVAVFMALVPQTRPDAAASSPAAFNFIDTLVNEKLERLGIVAAETCDDATFLRRVTLDLIGTLPTAEEARAFLNDPRPDKRSRWVDELLERPEFADYWALKWSDLLRVDREELGHKAAREYYQWIRRSFAENKPFDRFARELIAVDGPLLEQPQGAFYQAVQKPGDRAGTLSQVFLGVRIACAECHHHPFDRWSQTDYFGMAGYFSTMRSKPTPLGSAMTATGATPLKHPRTNEPVPLHPLGETPPTDDEEKTLEDPRRQLADWLTKPANPWFARNMANRLWAHFLGRGLVEPVDDVRATNPPSNPQLLTALAEHFVEHRYDVRELMKAIVSSAAYQRSNTTNPGNLRDEQNYSRALFKRLDAEVLLDAVSQVTDVPEKFSGTPLGGRAVQLWDSRASHYFLRIFGRPLRSTACSCERSVEPNVAQVLHLLNSPEIDAKLRNARGRMARLAASDDDSHVIEELYLTFYSRLPNAEERGTSEQFLKRPGMERSAAVEDLAWTLLNTLEFTFNH